MKRLFINLAFYITLAFLAIPLQANDIGSDSIVELFTTQVEVGEGDRIATFAALEAGFTFTGARPTATFDSIFPVTGIIALNGGTLVLDRDLVMDNVSSFSTLGDIIGNNHALDVAKSVSCLPLFDIVSSATAGTLDPTFDDDGIVTDTGGGTSIDFRSVTIQSDGKIVVIGKSKSPISSPSEFYLDRYNTDGSLDANISVDVSGNTLDQGYDVALQSDSKIVGVGDADSDFGVIRLTTAFALDTSFNTDGKVTTTIQTTDIAYGVAIQSDGKIIAAGTSDSDFAMVRYNTDGSEDYTFGGGSARVITSIGTTDAGNAVVLQTDGKIIIAGTSDSDFALARYDTDGTLDSSFGTGGTVTIDVGASDAGYGVTIQTDGKILVCGSTAAGSSPAVVIRLNTNGTLDTSFGNAGIQLINPIGSFTGFEGFDITLQSNDKIVVCGDAGYFQGENFTLAGLLLRLLNDQDCLIFSDLSICLDCNLKLNEACIIFEGNSLINGRGNCLTLTQNSEIRIAENATLLLKNLIMKGIEGTKISFLDSTSTVSLQNVQWVLSNDYNFTTGHFDTMKDWHLIGDGYTFVYNSDQQSTIQECGRLILDNGLTFSYDPTIADRDLIALVEATSQLILRGGTLSSTTTGLRLTKGELLVERNSSIACDATVQAEAISFGDGSSTSNDLDVQFTPGAVLQVTNGILLHNDA